MSLKTELGLEDNDKNVIFIASHDGVYVCDSGLCYEDFIDDICHMEIKDNTLYIYCVCDEKYKFSLDEYDIYYTDMANQVVVAFEPVKIETDEELNS